MEHVIVLLVIFSMNFAIQSFPIKNRFSVTFNPISDKEVFRPRTFDALFAKIPQEFRGQEAKNLEPLLTKSYIPQKSEVPSGYSNQVAKLLFSTEYVYNSKNLTRLSANHWGGLNYLILPIVRQPYDGYKILVATAPPHVQFGGDSKQTIIYVVFPEDGFSDSGANNLPIIYFVNEKNRKNNVVNKERVDPILIVNSNRTVTGLKSNEVPKFVRFKNKRTNRFNY